MADDAIDERRTATVSAALVSRLTRLNRLRAAAPGSLPHLVLEQFTERLDGASRRLAVYGSLAPGRANHRLLADLEGTWRHGGVRGVLEDGSAGPARGFPALRWEPAGELVPVQVLAARALPERWSRLDEFEGPNYLRILVPVAYPDGSIEVANLYAGRPLSRR